MQIELKNTAHEVGESPNKQKGRQANKAIVLSTLPPVLTLHVARFVDTEKRLGHAKFEENLDVGEYLDPRY
jgi:ubiquitin carboxyl-terminal hydrolase 16/45